MGKKLRKFFAIPKMWKFAENNGYRYFYTVQCIVSDVIERGSEIVTCAVCVSEIVTCVVCVSEIVTCVVCVSDIVTCVVC